MEAWYRLGPVVDEVLPTAGMIQRGYIEVIGEEHGDEG
jgi:hypothetical protein